MLACQQLLTAAVWNVCVVGGAPSDLETYKIAGQFVEKKNLFLSFEFISFLFVAFSIFPSEILPLVITRFLELSKEKTTTD